jgi:molecular chaperone GrpE
MSTRRGDPGDDAEGWESLSEETGGSLAPNPELEEAMREAMASVEARESEARAAAGAPAADPAEVAALRAEIASLQDRLLRLQADFDNFRKRTLREREEAYLYGHQNLVKDLLPTVDNLERAIEHARANDGADLEGLLQGVELVLRELHGALGRHGVSEIEAEGRPFDPALHEAMMQQPDATAAPNTVIRVFQKGYRLRDRMLRAARVLVSAAGNAEEKAPDRE